MFYDEKPSLEDLMHYGTPRHSGRYPWGSGKNPYQHSEDFLSRVETLQKEGKKETEIAEEIGLTTTQLRTQISLAKGERRLIKVDRARSLKEDGLSTYQIAEQMGIAESTVRSLLNTDIEARTRAARKTADMLKQQVDEKGMINISAGTELYLGVSKQKLQQALYTLEMEGYPTYGIGVPQVTNPGQQTNIKVLCPPGTKHAEAYNYENIHSLDNVISYDGGETFKKSFVYPESMDSKRLQIRYAEDGGINKDGVIELRRGVKDLDLGNSHYAQVRIMVDGTHYLKGMAVYSDDMPDGVDVIFNTNKQKGTPALGPKDNTVLKTIKKDPENPFGSLIKEHGGQSYYIDKDGKEKLSLINKRAEEGDWNSWADKLPSQFLAKQKKSLIDKQLGMSIEDKQIELDDILSLNNPVVKKKLLQSFASDCDAAAVHLKAAALPRQKYHVLLPLTSIKDTEVYAPNYDNGEQIALVRFPHAGTFEIPILTVNNKNREGRKLLGTNPVDAIGISAKVAERLSGADFDGDTVMTIPTGKNIHITSTPRLKELEGFDPKMAYPKRDGMKIMTSTMTQKEMGKISNLITDMQLKGAKPEELARAVKHSMVVIDAEKHELDYTKSERENRIAALKKRYQGHIDPVDGRYHEGASTLLSRASSDESVLKRRGSPIIEEDGSLSWKTATDIQYTTKTGEIKTRTQKSTKMAEAKDAHILSSGTPKEEAYANYANKLKNLANRARKEMISTPSLKRNPDAAKKYETEVKSLNTQLNVSLKNAPKESQANVIANAEVKAKIKAYPDMTKKEIKKAKQSALTRARIQVGAERKLIEISDKEWEAIQAGAISEHKLTQILNHTDIDKVKERATPRSKNGLSQAKISKISSMKASGYTTAEIAKSLGVSTSTVLKYLNQ